MRERLDEAFRLQFDADSTDRAMMIYSDVADSYRPDMSSEVKQLIVEALNRLWYIYYFELFDYADATECLETGLDICETDSIDASRLYLNKGVTYSLLTIRQKTPSLKIFEMADASLREAHRRSCHSGNINVADYALLNLIVLYDKMSRPIASLDTMLRTTAAMHADSRENLFPETLFNIVNYFQNKEFGRIPGVVDSCLAAYDFPQDEIRNKYQLLLYKARALTDNGQPLEAIRLLDAINADADSLGLSDLLMPVHEQKSHAYGRLGDTFETSRHLLAYYEQRDAQLSEETLMSINELPLIHDIKKSRNNLLIENYKRKSITAYAIFASLSLLLLGATVFIIVSKNRKLKNANRILFRRNEAWLKAFEDKNNELRQMAEQDTGSGEQADRTLHGDRNPVKDIEELRQVFEMASKTMESNRLWADPSLTISQLAVKMKVSEKLLSKAIHDCSDMNFSSFINSYRIMEASKMLSNHKDYGHLSLQGIAESVGFKSRTTFIASFKQFVGMLPSAYRKIALERRPTTRIPDE